MTAHKYSPSTGCYYPGFLDYPNLPDDVVEVSEEDYQKAASEPLLVTITPLKAPTKKKSAPADPAS